MFRRLEKLIGQSSPKADQGQQSHPGVTQGPPAGDVVVELGPDQPNVEIISGPLQPQVPRRRRSRKEDAKITREKLIKPGKVGAPAFQTLQQLRKKRMRDLGGTEDEVMHPPMDFVPAEILEEKPPKRKQAWHYAWIQRCIPKRWRREKAPKGQEKGDHDETSIGARVNRWRQRVDPYLLQARLVNNTSRSFNLTPPLNVTQKRLLRTEGVFHYILELSWPMILLIALLYYTIVNLFFALLYLFDVGPGGIGNTDSWSYQDAFFFSIQTMNTIGYGFFYPISVYVNIVVFFQGFVALVTYPLLTAIVVTKILQSRKLGLMLMFSKQAVANTVEFSYDPQISAYRQTGHPCLSFQVYYVRGTNVHDPTLRVFVARNVRYIEGKPRFHLAEISVEIQRRFGVLRESNLDPPPLPIPWQVIHKIDEESPFSKIDLGPDSFELIVVVEAYDSVMGNRFQRAFSYRYENIQWDHAFVDALSVTKDKSYQVDVNLLSETYAVGTYPLAA